MYEKNNSKVNSLLFSYKWIKDVLDSASCSSPSSPSLLHSACLWLTCLALIEFTDVTSVVEYRVVLEYKNQFVK